MGWVDKHGLNSPTGRGYGLVRDNPARVAPDRCRYDACIQVMPEFEDRVMRELGIITLPPGSYTRQRFSGCYHDLHHKVPSLHAAAVMTTGLRLDDRRPLVTIFLDDPHRMAEKDLRADICVPVAVMSSRDRAAASVDA